MSHRRAFLESLVSAAVRAPSGDNLQPWRFILDPHKETISIHLDPTRDRSPINAGQRMSRIACGAALENLVRTAQRKDWQVFQDAPAIGALARIRLHPNSNASNTDYRDEALQRRWFKRGMGSSDALCT